MDSSEEVLALRLHLENTEQWLSACKGKGKEQNIVDIDEAVKAQATELTARLIALEDRNMCASISKAVQDDGSVLSILQGEQNQILRDRMQASSLDEYDTVSSTHGHGSQPLWIYFTRISSND